MTASAEHTGARLAVLPFENLGDSADAYFADGITDEVRGKLTALPGIQITASQSSAEYQNTTKSPGTRSGASWGWTTCWWARCAGRRARAAPSRVQVSPELIGWRRRAKWQQPFDAALTDVFKVQADVAGRVAQALDVAIGAGSGDAGGPADRQPRGVRRVPQGKATRELGATPRILRQAVAYLEQAVALDSGFVAAWARAVGADSLLYSNGSPSPAVAEQGPLGGRPRVALNPERPEGYRALATTTGWSRHDRARRRAAYSAASSSRPTMPTCRYRRQRRAGAGPMGPGQGASAPEPAWIRAPSAPPAICAHLLLWRRRGGGGRAAGARAARRTPAQRVTA